MNLPALLAVASCAPAILAQQWVSLDGPHHFGRGVAYDSRRSRAVIFGSEGETWELDGNARLHRPCATGPFGRTSQAMVHDIARGHTLLFGGRTTQSLGDTWLWDGCTWRQPFLTVTPPRRSDAAITFDAARNRVVMFGGVDLGTALTDTWEHDGSQWIPFPGASAIAAELPQLTFDSVRGVCLLVASNAIAVQVSVSEWRSGSWTHVPTSSTPPTRRNGTTISYDPVRRRTVLFGGSASGNELWEWDAVAWRLVATAPFASFAPGMHFDPRRNATVIIDSQADEVTPRPASAWTWDGVAMTNVVVPWTPLPCQGPALFHDSARNRTVLHGGRRSGPVDETWEWDGLQWTRRTPATRPPPRQDAAACFDPVTATGFLFGGSSGGVSLADCWRWDGTTWSQLTVPAPQARSLAAMAWDPLRSEAILFGGLRSGAWVADTWRWNGTSWTQATTATAPTARGKHALAFDPGRGRLVLFGGASASLTANLNDTWEWDGTRWIQVLPVQSPLPLDHPCLVHDPARGRMLLVGLDVTNPSLPLRREWEYDGTTWTLAGSAPGRPVGSMRAIQDPLRQRVAVFATLSVTESTPTPARVEVQGSGCGAPPPLLAARTPPRTGEQQFGLELWTGASLPVLFALGFGAGSTLLGNGCTLLVQPVAATSFAPSNQSGLALLPLPLPPNQSLRGLVLHAQAGALDPTAPLGLAVSHGLRLTIGD